MSIAGKLAMSFLWAMKKTKIASDTKILHIKMDSASEELENARHYNLKHPYEFPRDKKALYKEFRIAGYPCILIRSKKARHIRGKVILYLHGGISNTWKEELMVARGYADHTGYDIFYPVYPSVSEVSLLTSIEVLYKVYSKIIQKYGAENTVIVGTSFGGTLGFELIDHNNRVEKPLEMPVLFIANSPGGVPDTDEDWRLMREFSKHDPVIDISAVENIESMQKLIDPDIPKYALCPIHEIFTNAPVTYVYYARETLAGNHRAYELRYKKCGCEDKMHMHIEDGMMHGYSCLPVFKESKLVFEEQINLINHIN